MGESWASANALAGRVRPSLVAAPLHTEIPIAFNSRLGVLLLQYFGKLLTSGAVLGLVWGFAVATCPRPNRRWPTLEDALVTPTAPIVFTLQSLVGAVIVGVTTLPLLVVLASAFSLVRATWLLRPAATVACLLIAAGVSRYLLAVVAYHAIDYNWDLGWNKEDFPTLEGFIAMVVLPTALAAVGTGWAAWTAGTRFLQTREIASKTTIWAEATRGSWFASPGER